ncbi:MAG: hypothetical protein NXI13_16405 [Proteobacteria bacterium]|nr:hypothetical protein [Pseudomonadota bacterium]
MLEDEELEETQVTDEESATIEPEKEEVEVEEEESAPSEEEKPRKGKSARKRIQQLTWQKRELERRLAEKSKSPPLVEPKEEDFEDHIEFVAEKAAFNARKALDEERKRDMEAKRIHERNEQVLSFEDKLDDTREKYDDFDDVWNADTPVSEHMAEALMDSDNAGEIAYYLGSNPDEAAKIANMQSPIAQAKAMGRLEQKLSTPKPKKLPTAPDPIQSRKGKTEEEDDGNFETDDFLKDLGYKV